MSKAKSLTPWILLYLGVFVYVAESLPLELNTIQDYMQGGIAPLGSVQIQIPRLDMARRKAEGR